MRLLPEMPQAPPGYAMAPVTSSAMPMAPLRIMQPATAGYAQAVITASSISSVQAMPTIPTTLRSLESPGRSTGREVSYSRSGSLQVPVGAMAPALSWAPMAQPVVHRVVQQQQQQQQPQQPSSAVMEGSVRHLHNLVITERERHQRVEAQLFAEMDGLRRRILALEGNGYGVVRHESLESNLDMRVAEIECRGNVRIDLAQGLVEVLREIAFMPRRTTETPVAELSDPSSASFIFDDVAEAASLVDGQVTVEGHTRGGESDFWAELAVDRARLVGKALIDRGIDQKRIMTRGLPGKCGLNRVAVLIHLGDAGGVAKPLGYTRDIQD